MVGLTLTPRIESFPANAPTSDLLTILYRDGALTIRSLIPLTSISAINAELKPHMDADYNSGLQVFAKQTKTVCGLAGKSNTVATAILQERTIRALVDDALTVVTESWWGDARNTCVSPPLLSSCFAVRVGPGSKRQGLHRDDQDHHASHRRGDPRDTTKLGCIIAMSKVTKENGATEVVPGSHVWDDERKPIYPDEVTYAEMEPGDVTLILGNCYHAAGANVTADSFRSVIVSLFCKGVYRQEENQFLAVDREWAAALPYDVQDLIGWKASAPFCGWHDLRNPSLLIRKDGGDNRDLF